MMTTYYKNALAGNIFGSKTTPPIPTTLYMGLSRTLPNADGTGVVEPAGNGYARVPFSAAALSEPIDGLVSNAQRVEFETSTGSWGMVRYYVIFDDVTGGNALLSDEMPTGDPENPFHNISSGYTLFFEPGEIKLRVSDGVPVTP